MINIFKKYGLILLITCLTACNGGGGSSSNPSPTPTSAQVGMDPGAGGVADGASNVSLTPTFVLKFANPMVASSINANTIQLSLVSAQSSHQTTTVNNIVLGNFTANSDNTLFTFTPLTPLNPATGYSLAVGNGAQTATGTNVSGQFCFTTGNYAIPTVALVSPNDNATGVSTTPTIQLQFNETMQNVTPANVTLHAGSASGATIAISSITAGANNNYTFSPVESLNQQTTYYVVLNGQISDNDGDALTPIIFNFTTGDFSTPVASILTPSNNATNVSVNPSIQIHFSKVVENVNPNNISLHAGSLYGATIAIESITAGANNTYSISPASTLNSLTAYYLDLSGGITDSHGNPLSFTSFNFTTGDFTAPTAVMLSPSNNATNVNPGTTNFTVVVQFSKPVQNITESTISVHSSSPTGPIIPLFVSPTQTNNNTYSITTNGSLSSHTQYFVVLNSGIIDNAGNSLVPVTFNFSTVLELDNIQNLAFNGQYAYIVNNMAYVTQCVVESSSGNFSNCKLATQSIIGAASGITFNNSQAYITINSKYYPYVNKCTVNQNSGALVACVTTGSLMNTAQNIIINNDNAYIANYGSGQIIQCTVALGGLLSNCSSTGSNFNPPAGIMINNGYAYIASPLASTVSKCPISTNGQIQVCTITGDVEFDSPTNIVMNNNYVYITDTFTGNIQQCSIDASGDLRYCNQIADNFNYPEGIRFNNGYAYIAEMGDGTITKCTVNNANGSFSNCTTM